MKNFRGQLPLRDADFARIRANVLSRVTKRERRGGSRLVFALAALVAVVFLTSVILSRSSARVAVRQESQTLTRLRHPLPASGERGDIAIDLARPQIDGPSPRLLGEGDRRPDEGLSFEAERRTVNAPQKSALRPNAETVAVHQTAVPAAPIEPLRIEIQTSDPEVRIIWFANQSLDTLKEES